MRHPLSLAAKLEPDTVARLAAMDPEPCGTPHHFHWLNGGKPLAACPEAVRNAQVRCLHSSNETLKDALFEATRRRLITTVQCHQMLFLLDGSATTMQWRADMLSRRLGDAVCLNLTGKPYDETQAQWQLGLDPSVCHVGTLTTENVGEHMRRIQVRATQVREDMRQILLRLFAAGGRTRDDDEDIDALMKEKFQVS